MDSVNDYGNNLDNAYNVEHNACNVEHNTYCVGHNAEILQQNNAKNYEHNHLSSKPLSHAEHMQDVCN